MNKKDYKGFRVYWFTGIAMQAHTKYFQTKSEAIVEVSSLLNHRYVKEVRIIRDEKN